jgi:fibronectin-binding autotransporter adhesin
MLSGFFGLIDIIRCAVGIPVATRALAKSASVATAVIASCLLVSGPARAQTTYTWTGYGSIFGNTSWDLGLGFGLNWSSTGSPAAGDTANFTDSSFSTTITLATDAVSIVNVTGTLGYTWSAGTLTVGNSFNYGSSGSSTFSGILAGAGNLTVSAGTLTLSGANTYTGTTTISGGTLSAASIVVSGGSSNLGNATSAVVLSGSGTLTYTGVAATYTRGFTIGSTGGGLTNTTANLLTVATGAVSATGTFTLGSTSSGGITVSSTISGTGGAIIVNSSGAGIVTLSGSNSYTGGTTVTAGTLSAANSGGSATGAGSVTVSSGGILSGSSTGGTITLGSGKLVIINSGGTLSPGLNGVSVGTLTIATSGSGQTSFANGSTFAWNINNATPASAAKNTGGSDSAGKQDLLTSSGALTLGTINFAVNEVTTMTLNSNSTYSWKVATYTGTAPSTSGVTFNTANAPGIRAYLAAHSNSLISLVASGGSLYLNLAPTPEPQHILFICLGAMGIALFIRRRWLSVAVVP